MNVIETSSLGKRYRRTWGLRDCTLSIPAGHIVALVGPNGAGKTTLLHCSAGLAIPTTGQVSVLGRLAPGSLDALERVAFVAQDAPLHSYLTVAAMLDLSRDLNRRFDRRHAEHRLRSLSIPLHRKVGKLSGGQHAQLALALALARRPDLLVLDEPLARLSEAMTRPGSKTDAAAWLSAHHYVYWLSYQPAGRFWYFQAVAAAVLVALAIVFALTAVWLIRRRG